MVCFGNEQRSFCRFWDCIQVLHFGLFCWPWWLLHFFWAIPARSSRYNGHLTFHFHALEKEMATHSSVLAWRIPGTGEPGGLPSMGSHRVGHDWSKLAAAAELNSPISDHFSSLIPRMLTFTLAISCLTTSNLLTLVSWLTRPPDLPLEKFVCRSGSNS